MGYIAKGNIMHNGKSYAAGDEVKDLSEEQANRLIGLEVLEKDGSNDTSAVKHTVKEIEALVAGMDDALEIEKLLEGEDRTGAIKAIQTRLEELKKNA